MFSCIVNFFMPLAIFRRVEIFCRCVGKFWRRVGNILPPNRVFLGFTERPFDSILFLFQKQLIEKSS